MRSHDTAAKMQRFNVSCRDVSRLIERRRPIMSYVADFSEPPHQINGTAAAAAGEYRMYKASKSFVVSGLLCATSCCQKRQLQYTRCPKLKSPPSVVCQNV